MRPQREAPAEAKSIDRSPDAPPTYCRAFRPGSRPAEPSHRRRAMAGRTTRYGRAPCLVLRRTGRRSRGTGQAGPGWRPWPPGWTACTSHARTTTEPPPHPAANSRQRACPPPGRMPGSQGNRGWFPRSPDHRSARPALSYTPAVSPRLRRRPSAWPPHRLLHTASELTPRTRKSRTAPPAPIRQI